MIKNIFNEFLDFLNLMKIFTYKTDLALIAKVNDLNRVYVQDITTKMLYIF